MCVHPGGRCSVLRQGRRFLSADGTGMQGCSGHNLMWYRKDCPPLTHDCSRCRRAASGKCPRSKKSPISPPPAHLGPLIRFKESRRATRSDLRQRRRPQSPREDRSSHLRRCCQDHATPTPLVHAVGSAFRRAFVSKFSACTAMNGGLHCDCTSSSLHASVLSDLPCPEGSAARSGGGASEKRVWMWS